jgi:hypothetical protein
MPPKKRLRQSSKPILNKLEERFYARIKLLRPLDEVVCQGIRLELARGIWYRPDLFIPDALDHLGTGKRLSLAYEVKGPHAFRGGFENLKVAARVHRWIQFRLVWEADGGWQEQIILP